MAGGKFYAKQTEPTSVTEPVSVDTAFSVVRRSCRSGLCLFFADFSRQPCILAYIEHATKLYFAVKSFLTAKFAKNTQSSQRKNVPFVPV